MLRWIAFIITSLTAAGYGVIVFGYVWLEFIDIPQNGFLFSVLSVAGMFALGWTFITLVFLSIRLRPYTTFSLRMKK